MKKQLAGTIEAFFKKEFGSKIQKKLTDGYPLKKLKVNPFTMLGLSKGILGEANTNNMAKCLLYPHIFGTSINTTFGNMIQKLCTQVLNTKASSTPGMDIEFTDQVDGKAVILQLKAGPNTLNKDDVAPMLKKMESAYRLLKTNYVDELPEFAVGIAYGTEREISSHYKKINASLMGPQTYIPIYVGQNFWHRLTGDPKFYSELIKLFMQTFDDIDCSKLFTACVKKLASEIEDRYFQDGSLDLTKI